MYRKLMCGAFLLMVSLVSCSDKNPEIELPDPVESKEYELSEAERVFGFYNQHRYSYCPSVIKEPDGTVHMFFTGNPEQTVMVDHVYHIRINPDGTQSEAKSVVQPGEPGTWDDHHICDPSVIAGDFTMKGKSYRYAMFYLTNRHGVYYNEVGVAFSNDLEADSWEKYPEQLVSKPWEHEGDEMLAGGGRSWGTGQPSAVSLDQKGKVLLTYTVGDRAGTRIEWAELDLTDMDNYTQKTSVRIVENGLVNMNYSGQDYTCNSDFAIDPEEDIILMVRPVQPHPSTYPAFINESLEVNYMSFSDFRNRTGKWKTMIRIAPYMTGFARNHNAAIERDKFGIIENWKKPKVYYTVSKAAPEVFAGATTHAEWTYHIYSGLVISRSE